MPILNRDNGLSQQRDVLTARVQLPVTGESYALINIPYPCALQAAYFGAAGLSGSPQYALRVLRFSSGGATTVNLGVSNQIISTALGVSGGAQGWSGIATLGGTLLQLQTGDVVVLGTAGTNAAARELAVSLVVQKTQDIVSHFGLAT